MTDPAHMQPESPDQQTRELFKTRSHAWRAVGLERELTMRQLSKARKQALTAVILLPLLVGVVVLFSHRHELFPGADPAVRIISVVILVSLGWVFARAVGRALAPPLFRRMDPGTAGTVGFLIRLVTIGI